VSKLLRVARLPFLVTILAPFILLSPVFLTGKALFWGTPALQFIPWWDWAWQTLRGGHLPLWNPLLGMGAPLIANYQSALFYPPNWIYFLLDAVGGAPGMAWGQAILVAVHLAWAGLGMVYLTRRIGLGELAQTVSGLAYGLSGYLVARSGFLSINAAAAWTPWVVLMSMPPIASGQSVKKVKGVWDKSLWGLVGCLSMQLLAGHAQTTWYTLLFAGMWSGYWGWAGRDRVSEDANKGQWVAGLRGTLKAWTRLGLAGILAVCVSAIQLIPTAEYLLQSQRSANVNYELTMTYSFWPWRLITLFAPDMFGSPAKGNYWGYGNYWEDAIYVGLLPILLALAATGGLFKRKQKAIRRSLLFFLLLVIAVSFLLALGKNTPVFPWLYQHVPTFAMFQAPARYLIWVGLSLALLAGLGAEGWKRPEGKALYWTRLGTAGAFAVTLGAGLAWYGMGKVSPTFVQATALAGLWGLVCGGLSLSLPSGLSGQGRRRMIWPWLVGVFIAVDLLAAGWGLNPGTGLSFYRDSSTLFREAGLVTYGGRLYLPYPDEQKLKYERFLRFDTFYPGEDWQNLRAVLLPNLNLLEGIPSVNNFDPLVPGAYSRWMEALDQATPQQLERLLALMDVGVIEYADQGAPSGVRLEPFKPALSGAENVVRRGSLRWAPCARAATGLDNAQQLILDNSINLEEEVVIETGSKAALLDCNQAKGTGSGQVYSEIKDPPLRSDPNHLDLRVQASDAGWLVWSEVWYPGWKAWVDGEPAPIFRADSLFRAVQVPGGQHTVVFAYQPISFYSGAAISVATVFLLVMIALRLHLKSEGR
jgi:hypothetical protein